MDLSILSEQIAQQDALEWGGLATGILYVFFAANEKSICWIFGIISSACIAWKSFFDYRLIADGMLQVFYIGIGFLGLWKWMSGTIDHHPKPVITTPLSNHLMATIICFLLSIPTSWFLIHYAKARYGYLDTALTLLSIYATFLLIKKDLHNWVYWIVIDIVYVALYLKSEGLLFALLFLIYTLFSFWGLRQWNKHTPGVS